MLIFYTDFQLNISPKTGKVVCVGGDVLMKKYGFALGQTFPSGLIFGLRPI